MDRNLLAVVLFTGIIALSSVGTVGKMIFEKNPTNSLDKVFTPFNDDDHDDGDDHDDDDHEDDDHDDDDHEDGHDDDDDDD